MPFETHELESEAFLYKPATAVETTRKLIDSDLLEVVYTSRPRVNGRYTYRCFQISTFFLSVSTVILIILLAQQYQRSERECIKKQSIYCSSSLSLQFTLHRPRRLSVLPVKILFVDYSS